MTGPTSVPFGSFNARGELDPASSPMVFTTGPKGSGKTVYTLLLASSWPYDMVVIDVAGDDGPMPGKPGEGSHDVHTYTGPVDELPRSWPEHLRADPPRPMILRYVPDPGSPTELEDMDAMAGLAMAHSGNPRPCLLVIHEIGRVAPAGRTPPHMRRVLNHSRHRRLGVLMSGPRPKTVDPLCVQQADLVAVFSLRSAADRQRVQENIGWDRQDFDDANHALRKHEYLLYDAHVDAPEGDGEEDLRLVHMSALPEDVVAQVRAWAGTGPTARPV